EHEAAPVERAGDDVGKLLAGERLLDEIVGALAHGPHGKLHVAVAGDEDDRHVGVDVAHARQKRHAVHAGHAYVADDDPGEAGRDEVERCFRAGKVAHVEAGQLQRLHGGAADILLVVDEEHGGLLHSAASRTGIPAASSVMVATVPPSGCCSTASMPPKSLTML